MDENRDRVRKGREIINEVLKRLRGGMWGIDR